MSSSNKLGVNLRMMNFQQQCHAKVSCIPSHYDDVLWCVTGNTQEWMRR